MSDVKDMDGENAQDRRSHDRQLSELHDDVLELTAKHHELKAWIDAKLNNGIRSDIQSLRAAISDLKDVVAENVTAVSTVTTKVDGHIASESDVVGDLKTVITTLTGIKKFVLVVGSIATAAVACYGAWIQIIAPMIAG
jgi:hypothetical protein